MRIFFYHYRRLNEKDDYFAVLLFWAKETHTHTTLIMRKWNLIIVSFRLWKEKNCAENRIEWFVTAPWFDPCSSIGNDPLPYSYPNILVLSLPCLRHFCDITIFYNYLRAWMKIELSHVTCLGTSPSKNSNSSRAIFNNVYLLSRLLCYNVPRM